MHITPSAHLKFIRLRNVLYCKLQSSVTLGAFRLRDEAAPELVLPSLWTWDCPQFTKHHRPSPLPSRDVSHSVREQGDDSRSESQCWGSCVSRTELKALRNEMYMRCGL